MSKQEYVVITSIKVRGTVISAGETVELSSEIADECGSAVEPAAPALKKKAPKKPVVKKSAPQEAFDDVFGSGE